MNDDEVRQQAESNEEARGYHARFDVWFRNFWLSMLDWFWGR